MNNVYFAPLMIDEVLPHSMLPLFLFVLIYSVHLPHVGMLMCMLMFEWV